MKKPLRETHPQVLQAIARAINGALDSVRPEKGKMGFVLLVFPFDEQRGSGDYVSSCAPEDIPKVLRETLKTMEIPGNVHRT